MFKGLVIGILLGVALVVGGVWFYFTTGRAPVGVIEPPLPFEKKLAHGALNARIQRDGPKESLVPADETNYLAAAEVYKENCAVCHGATGKGNGPAASAFTKPPSDLTMLARKNNGKCPAQHVYTVLKFGTSVPAHGNLEMPVWNTVFRALNATHEPNDAVTRLRLNNLVEYIQGLQAK